MRETIDQYVNTAVINMLHTEHINMFLKNLKENMNIMGKEVEDRIKNQENFWK